MAQREGKRPEVASIDDKARAELARLRLALASAGRSRRSGEGTARGKNDKAGGNAAGVGADGSKDGADAELLREALAGVAPLKQAPRAELARPKPAPLPRPQPQPEPAAPEAPRRAARLDQLDDAALFRAMLEDVKPLASSDRADMHAVRPQPHRRDADVPTTGGTPALFGLLAEDAATLAPDALFALATRGTKPLDQRNRVEPTSPRPAPEPAKRCEDELATLRESLEAPLTFEDRLDMGEEAAFLRPGLPRRVLVDLRRGRWVLQGELDLHGLTREEARAALSQFLAASLSRGRRCVRVIHGKGLGSPGKVSILKQLSRGWLAQREEILAFCQAGPHHGGSGALTVLLRAPDLRAKPVP